MPRPASVFSWASSVGAYVATIPSTIRQLGWAPFTVSVVEQVNQSLREVGDWIGFLEPFFPADGKMEIGRITGTGDPDMSGDGLYITTDGTGAGITVQPAVNDSINVRATGSGNIFVTSENTAWFGTVVGFDVSGFLVEHPTRRITVWPDSGFGKQLVGDEFRIPYQPTSLPVFTVNYWPGYGGWSLQNIGPANDVGTEVLIGDNGTDWAIINGTAGVKTTTLRRPFSEIKGNSEANGTIYRITALNTTWGPAGDFDPVIKLVKRSRNSYTITVLATVDRVTPTWTGTAAIDDRTEDVYLEYLATTTATLGDNATGLRRVLVTFSKAAVE